MKNRIFLALGCLLAFGLLAGCSKNESTVSCNLKAAEELVTSSELPFRIHYRVESTGDAAASRVVFLDGTGTLNTETATQLPWSKTVTIVANAKASLSATGKLTSGELKISITGSNGDTDINAVDSCRQSITITREGTTNDPSQNRPLRQAAEEYRAPYSVVSFWKYLKEFKRSAI